MFWLFFFFAALLQRNLHRLIMNNCLPRSEAYGETTWQRLVGSGGVPAAERRELELAAPQFYESCLDELYGLIQSGDMRITLSPGSVRVTVHAASPLSQQALLELNTEAFATLCEFATRANWTDVPIDGVQLFAWHGECVPSFSLPQHIREVRSESAVFFEISGVCTRESGVSMAKVLLRALSAAGCAKALTWFVSADEAFFPDCEIDSEQRAIFVREIEKVGSVLKSDTVAMAECRQASRIREKLPAVNEVQRVLPFNTNCTVLCLLWYQRANDEERTKALSIAQQVVARHPRNDWSPIERASQIWWPSRNFASEEKLEDVLYMNVSMAELDQTGFDDLLARAKRCSRLQVLDVSRTGIGCSQLTQLLEQLPTLRLLVATDLDHAECEKASKQHPLFRTKCSWSSQDETPSDEELSLVHQQFIFKRQLELIIYSRDLQ
jgi:hypothetical protein